MSGRFAPEKAPDKPSTDYPFWRQEFQSRSSGQNNETLELIETANQIAGKTVGRIDQYRRSPCRHKIQRVYECPAATIILEATKT